MPRKPRVVAAGVPRHVTQRGNNRQVIFLIDDDRRFYLAALAANSQRYGLRVVGYCLRTHHVHLVVVPNWADALELPPTEQDERRLRQATLAGLPLGESEFVEALEQAFARRMIPGRPGRRPNSTAVAV